MGPSRIVERPKVIYNSQTKKYVLWMHIDNTNYSEAKVGVATGDTVCGSYEYLGSWQPLGHQSRDMGLFQDDDGTAYLLSEDVSRVFSLFSSRSCPLSVFIVFLLLHERLTFADLNAYVIFSGKMAFESIL